ncbi:MAG: hypothetical protein AAF446_05925 [Pseudomonadota bacterium]
MYKVQRLLRVARRGLSDMLPALRVAWNNSREDDRLNQIFGPRPRSTIAGLTIGGIAIGLSLENAFDYLPLLEYIDLPAILIGAIYAFLIRHYLFQTNKATNEDFPWLAAALIPPALTLVVLSFIQRASSGGLDLIVGAPAWTGIGALLDTMVDSMAVAAGLTIAVAALCYSRDWREAFKDLAVQLIAFKIMVFVMVLLLVEIGIVGPILGRLLEAIFGINFPHWLPDLADQLTYAGLMGTIYLALIGATWTACSRSFARLLETGEADVLTTIRAMADTPEQRRKKIRKERRLRAKESAKDKTSES